MNTIAPNVTPATTVHHEPKWAAIVGDRLVPMPRRVVAAHLIKTQSGLGTSHALVRDHNSPHDVVLEDDAEVDLGLGNVFYGVPRCELLPRPACSAAAKLAFVVNDIWKVVTRVEQTGASIRELFGLLCEHELLRDYTSPIDDLIGEDEPARFTDGPVFRTVRTSIQIFVNNKPVTMHRRRVTALDLKRAAIEQGVSICPDCVLYQLKSDGSHNPAIRDDEHIALHCDEHFRCIAPDDNS